MLFNDICQNMKIENFAPELCLS